MKKLIILLTLLSFFFSRCEKEEESVERCWYCNTFTRMWQTEIDLSGNIISVKQVWWPTDTVTYCSTDGYDQTYIERRIEMHSEKKKIVCYP